MNGGGGATETGADDGNLLVHFEIVLKLHILALLRRSEPGAASTLNRSSTAGTCFKSLWQQSGPRYFWLQSRPSFFMR